MTQQKPAAPEEDPFEAMYGKQGDAAATEKQNTSATSKDKNESFEEIKKQDASGVNTSVG